MSKFRNFSCYIFNRNRKDKFSSDEQWDLRIENENVDKRKSHKTHDGHNIESIELKMLCFSGTSSSSNLLTGVKGSEYSKESSRKEKQIRYKNTLLLFSACVVRVMRVYIFGNAKK